MAYNCMGNIQQVSSEDIAKLIRNVQNSISGQLSNIESKLDNTPAMSSDDKINMLAASIQNLSIKVQAMRDTLETLKQRTDSIEATSPTESMSSADVIDMYNGA